MPAAARLTDLRQARTFSPLYQQIKVLILRDLQAGVWRPGEAIPSEDELAGRFKVSQGTVRKAIDELATENLLVRRQGKGTFVATHAEQTTQFRFLRLQPDEVAPEGTARAMQRRFIDCRRLRAPRRRGAGPGSALRRRRHADQAACCRFATRRWCSTTSGCPAAVQGPDRRAAGGYRGPMYGLFEVRVRRAHDPRRREDPRRRCRCRGTAELLAVPVGAPLLWSSGCR